MVLFTNSQIQYWKLKKNQAEDQQVKMIVSVLKSSRKKIKKRKKKSKIKKRKIGKNKIKKREKQKKQDQSDQQLKMIDDCKCIKVKIKYMVCNLGYLCWHELLR